MLKSIRYGGVGWSIIIMRDEDEELHIRVNGTQDLDLIHHALAKALSTFKSFDYLERIPVEDEKSG